MRMSTKGRYGVRLMIDLALHSGEGPVLLKDIARRQGISEKYLWNLINPLKTVGLVRSIRGAHGGYQLGRVAASISAAEIIDAIEGPVAITECSGIHSACDLETVCSTGNAWQRVNAAIRRSLDEISLAQLSGQEAVAVWRPSLRVRP